MPRAKKFRRKRSSRSSAQRSWRSPRAAQRPRPQEDWCHGADVLSLAKRVRWTADRPGEAAEGTGERELSTEATAG